MNKHDELMAAYGHLGEASASLYFAGYNRLSEEVRELHSVVADYAFGEEK